MGCGDLSNQAMKPLGLAGTIAVAMKTAEIATEKIAATKRVPVSEVVNMGVFPFFVWASETISPFARLMKHTLQGPCQIRKTAEFWGF